ncbi:MAG: mechanosensitive ion channel [Ardenticatenaceae bacterium]|nr:mechanosensitive ion channel [Anaerolineales bacterium]MCB9009141.1 mechanosensitive ion channel [Ardenticatenaceae bacterium]
MIDFSVIQNAFGNMVASAINYIPRLVTALIILLAGWLLAKIIANLVQRLGQKLHLENLLERTGIKAGLEKAQINRSGTQLVGLLLFWIIFLNFILIALESLGLNAAVEPLRGLIAFLPRLLAALATLTAGILLAQFLGKAAQAAMSSMGVDFHQEVGQGVNILLIVMIVIVVLEQLGIDANIMATIFTNVITLAVAGLALAFGLGGRDVTRNVLAGYYAREQFEMGDHLVIDGEIGTLEAVGTLNAELRMGSERLIIPNTVLTETAVKVKNPGWEQPILELDE